VATSMVKILLFRAKNFGICALHFAIVFSLLLVSRNITAAETSKDYPKRPARVWHVGESPKGPYVVINRGSSQKYVIGTEVCLYDDRSQETGCGVIEQTNSTASGIRLPKDEKHLVVEGNRAWSLTWGPLPQPDGYAVNDDSDTSALVEAEAQAVAEEPSLLMRRISYQYVAGLVPLTAKTLEFNAAARASGTGSVWRGGSVSQSSYVGFLVDFRLPNPGPWDTGYQIGYSFLHATPVVTDFDLTDASKTVESSVSGHFYRLGWSKGYGIITGDSLRWMVSGGADLWIVSHKFRADSSDGTSLAGGAIYNGLLTLPVSTWTEVESGGWTWSFGLDFQVPIYMKGNRVTGVIGYNENTTAEKDIGSIGEAVDVKKSFGVLLKIGLGAKI